MKINLEISDKYVEAFVQMLLKTLTSYEMLNEAKVVRIKELEEKLAEKVDPDVELMKAINERDAKIRELNEILNPSIDPFIPELEPKKDKYWEKRQEELLKKKR